MFLRFFEPPRCLFKGGYTSDFPLRNYRIAMSASEKLLRLIKVKLNYNR